MKNTKLITCFVLLTVQFLIAQNFWQQAYFPSYYSGQILDIAAKDNQVLAASYNNGLALSTDTGEHWSSMSFVQACYSVGISNAGYLFALGFDDLLYRSTNAGVNWMPCTSMHFYNSPKIVTSENGNIYVGSSAGVYRSTDEGVTWTQQNNGLVVGGGSPYTLLNVSGNGLLVAATPSGIFKSIDNANSWIQISLIGATNLAINSSGYIFANKHRADPHLHLDTLYRTTNNGSSWQSLRYWGGNFIYINPVDDAIVIADYSYTSNYFISTDMGIIWTTVTTETSPNDMTFNNVGEYFMSVEGEGLSKSNSLLGPWVNSNTGFPGSVSKVSSIISNGGKTFSGSSSFGLFSSSDNGMSFTKITPGLSNINKISATSNGYMFAIYGTIYRSTDLGLSWNYYPPPGVLYDLSPFSLCTNGNIILTGGQRSMSDAELDRSADNGETWEEVFSIEGFPYDVEYKIIALSINSTGTVLGCIEKRKNTNPPTWTYSYAVIRSTNFGSSWATSAFVYDRIKEFDWDYSNNVFAISSQGLLISTDDGINWNYTTGVLPSTFLQCIKVSYDNVIYIGTGNNGVIYSSDFGNSWNLVNQGLTDTQVNTISISLDGFLFAGAEHGGVFRSIDPITSIISTKEIFSQTYKLSQNYPNPFNPSTVISYRLPVTSNVTLKVYDVLGNEIATLVNEEKQPGTYEVEFNGEKFPSGVYFYQLKAGGPESGSGQGIIETNKMVLMK